MRLGDLRPHQVKAVEGLRARWKQCQAHLINAPAGAGKTAIAAYLCSSLAERGLRVVFAAPYVTLVDQTWKRFQQYGMASPSVIWQKDPRYNESALIHIASADTLICRDEKLPPNTDVLIWDECHIRRADLLQHIKENPELKVIGLSATPFPKWMGENYQNFVKPCTTRELIEKEWLVPFDIYCPNLGESRDRMRGVKTYAGDYAQGESAAAMMETKIVGDILGNWMTHGVNDKGAYLPTIGFAVNKAAANAYCIEFQRAGIAAEVITDKTPKEERKRIFEAFDAGIVKVIWNVGVLGAGFDADVRCIIWARPTKSEIVWIQGALRGSRPAEGKKSCILFDHTPTFFEIGDPCDIEYYELHDGSDGLEKVRQERREKEKREHRAKTCGKCGRKKDAGEYKCKKCGHKPLAGELPETDESIQLRKANGEKRQFAQEQKQEYWSGLMGLRQQHINAGKNYQKAYYSNLYREKFSVWPKSLSDTAKPPSQEILGKVKSMQIAWAKSKNNPKNKAAK